MRTVITNMKTVPYIMPTYENPWDTFDSYLEENGILPEEASGLRFYMYLLRCIQVVLGLVFSLEQSAYGGASQHQHDKSERAGSQGEVFDRSCCSQRSGTRRASDAGSSQRDQKRDERVRNVHRYEIVLHDVFLLRNGGHYLR